MAVYCIIYLACVLTQITVIECQPMVTVEQGKLIGKTVKFESEFLGVSKPIDVYLGIPYAEPPVGEGRFRPPVAKEPWDDEVYNATYARDICMQVDEETEFFSVSEDCLHLNIYVPNPQPSNAAVMVFIHGGSFTTGNGYQGYYGGSALAAIGDVILVTINYRLSTFGFLTTGDEASPGNYGMLDQVEALRWINNNILAFGGDPNRITIFGESAGASCVSAHLFSPLSEPLFQQAILQSGSSLDDWSHHEDLDEQRGIAFQLGELVGCSASDTQELMSCLRQVDAEELIQASYNMNCHVSKERFDPEVPGLITAYGRYSNDLIEDGLKQVYVDWSKVDNPEANYFDEWNSMLTDYWFSCPAIFETRLHAKADAHDVYLYHYTHTPSIPFEIEPTWTAATHGEELHFVFGYPFDIPPHLDFHEYPEEEMTFSHQVIKYWTNFAKTGNPNKESPTSLPYDDDREWPAFTLQGLQYKDLGLNLTTGKGLRANECHFWNDYLEKLTTFTTDLDGTVRQWKEDFFTWKHTDLEEWREAFKEYKIEVNEHSEL